MGRCNCGTWACRLDAFLHMLRIHWDRVCDAHDRQILGMDKRTWDMWNDPNGAAYVYLDEQSMEWKFTWKASDIPAISTDYRP